MCRNVFEAEIIGCDNKALRFIDDSSQSDEMEKEIKFI